MNYDWSIWKAKVGDGDVRFVHNDDLPASGFASVYCFTEADARSMEALGTYKSFKGTVHSETLKLDCDTPEASVSTEKRLQEKGLAYEKYTTGNRGFHFHVKRLVVASHLVPAIDKAYVAREFPGADVSFYHHVGMYRQIGARHHKTGERKALIASIDGTTLDLRGEGIPQSPVSTVASANSGMQSWFTDHRLGLLAVPYGPGENRRNAFCAIAVRLAQLGQPLEWGFVYLSNVNLMSPDPLAEAELYRILEWGYSQ